MRTLWLEDARDDRAGTGKGLSGQEVQVMESMPRCDLVIKAGEGAYLSVGCIHHGSQGGLYNQELVTSSPGDEGLEKSFQRYMPN